MVTLGISAYFHDSAAAIFVDGRIVAGAPEERFSRIKHDNSFPAMSCAYCLEEAHLTISDVEAIIFYEKPFVKFERILETHIKYAPRTFGSFLKSVPIWLKERLNMKRTIRKELKKMFGKNIVIPKVLFSSHHISHAATAFYTSGFEESAILVIDAVGEWATTSLFYGDDKGITSLKQQNFPHSIGMLYSAFTHFLGFKVNSDEYKVMGLAPYGDTEEAENIAKLIKSHLVNVQEEACPTLNLDYFSHQYGNRIIKDDKWEKLFGIRCRLPEEPITQHHKDIAFAIQKVTEEIVVKIARHLKEITRSSTLCISGGTAMNCAINGVIERSGIFEKVFIPFAPGDSGAAIGACLAYANTQVRTSPYIGPEYTKNQIKRCLEQNNIHFIECESYSHIYKLCVDDIVKGAVVGWFQGRMEFGPRALGNRSILCDARNQNAKELVNKKIKFREAFRPFAPVILEEEAKEYYDMIDNSPYMAKTYHCKNDVIPATTHVDKSARVQTVNERDNMIFYQLLSYFKKVTGCPVLLNTSLNVMGDSMVCSPLDAIETFKKSGMDSLAIGLFYITKEQNS